MEKVENTQTVTKIYETPSFRVLIPALGIVATCGSKLEAELLTDAVTHGINNGFKFSHSELLKRVAND